MPRRRGPSGDVLTTGNRRILRLPMRVAICARVAAGPTVRTSRGMHMLTNTALFLDAGGVQETVDRVSPGAPGIFHVGRVIRIRQDHIRTVRRRERFEERRGGRDAERIVDSVN